MKTKKAWAIINNITGEPFMPYFETRQEACYWKLNRCFKFVVDYKKTKIAKVEIKILTP